MDYEKMLTKGALRCIKNNEKIEGPVIQVIYVGKMLRKHYYNDYDNTTVKNCYNLTVSDGENIINSVELGIHLNSMLDTGILTKFSLIKINNYLITNIIEPAKEPRQVIIFSNLAVIVPGSIIFKTIGNPRPISNNIEPIPRTEASVLTIQVYEECRILHTKQEIWKSLIERGLYSRLLTVGALQSILDNVEVKYPVMQVINIRQLIDTASGLNKYRLMISDGQHFSTFVMLATRLNNMITNGYLTKFSIIYIRSYVVGLLGQSIKKVIILTDLVCLVTRPGAMIGDPKPVREISGQVIENSIPASIPEPIVEMDTLAPSISPIDQDQEVENLPLNLDMLHIS
ncbi:uncharacterized protein LOC100570100 [Acyrthosiphon pisum]|uniref:Replication factor-A protein 1 N-terminal domain-containing protein n=1 Tax=Acyrthosiphon pisum TaxID=7029 RepID=A0A8R1W600_ACYPI|nr:uncharacterized protein LOC100570100 [Acyrthosiphon pisum]|eukprot:XP_003245862.1 PREDICTED: uncharacterized protein LOC100570100 [Acyrthosiphon pisum]